MVAGGARRPGNADVSAPGWPPTGAGAWSGPGDPALWMRAHLFDRRVVLLDGLLDDARTNQVATDLMTLDATGDGAVDLHIDCPGGSTGAALALMDVIDLLGVTVRAWCTGQAVGPAVGVLAVCHHGTMSAHARLHLIEPTVGFEGSTRHLQQQAEAHAAQWATFCDRLAEATGRPVGVIREDTARGRFLTASEAVAYGVVDVVAPPKSRILPLPGPPIGFRPR